MDDNLNAFHRLNRDMIIERGRQWHNIQMHGRFYIKTIKTIAVSGPNYYSFVKSTDAVKPYTVNTRIYSCLLRNNSLTYRWRGTVQ